MSWAVRAVGDQVLKQGGIRRIVQHRQIAPLGGEKCSSAFLTHFLLREKSGLGIPDTAPYEFAQLVGAAIVGLLHAEQARGLERRDESLHILRIG